MVFGYAANFKVPDIPTAVVGPGASQAAALLREPTFHVTDVDPAAGESGAQAPLAKASPDEIVTLAAPAIEQYLR